MSVELNQKDEAKVSQVLASLPHVEPPGDFDVRVRSQIASGRPQDRRSWFWPILVGATPLVLLLAIGAYFVTRPEIPASSIVASAPSTVQSPTIQRDGVPTNAANNTTVLPIPDGMIAKAPTTDNKMVVQTTPVRGPNVGSSVDMSVTERTTINPRGIPLNSRQAPRPRDFDNVIAIPIKDVLTQLGADSQGTTSGVRVLSVTNDGAANRLGLRANDVIESIDDKPVNDKTSYKGKFAGKRMKVVRDGQPVEIDLSKP